MKSLAGLMVLLLLTANASAQAAPYIYADQQAQAILRADAGQISRLMDHGLAPGTSRGGRERVRQLAGIWLKKKFVDSYNQRYPQGPRLDVSDVRRAMASNEKAKALADEMLQLGHPLSNLFQRFSQLDNGIRLEATMSQCQREMAGAGQTALYVTQGAMSSCALYTENRHAYAVTDEVFLDENGNEIEVRGSTALMGSFYGEPGVLLQNLNNRVVLGNFATQMSGSVSGSPSINPHVDSAEFNERFGEGSEADKLRTSARLNLRAQAYQRMVVHALKTDLTYDVLLSDRPVADMKTQVTERARALCQHCDQKMLESVVNAAASAVLSQREATAQRLAYSGKAKRHQHSERDLAVKMCADLRAAGFLFHNDETDASAFAAKVESSAPSISATAGTSSLLNSAQPSLGSEATTRVGERVLDQALLKRSAENNQQVLEKLAKTGRPEHALLLTKMSDDGGYLLNQLRCPDPGNMASLADTNTRYDELASAVREAKEKVLAGNREFNKKLNEKLLNDQDVSAQLAFMAQSNPQAMGEAVLTYPPAAGLLCQDLLRADAVDQAWRAGENVLMVGAMGIGAIALASGVGSPVGAAILGAASASMGVATGVLQLDNANAKEQLAQDLLNSLYTTDPTLAAQLQADAEKLQEKADELVTEAMLSFGFSAVEAAMTVSQFLKAGGKLADFTGFLQKAKAENISAASLQNSDEITRLINQTSSAGDSFTQARLRKTISLEKRQAIFAASDEATFTRQLDGLRSSDLQSRGAILRTLSDESVPLAYKQQLVARINNASDPMATAAQIRHELAQSKQFTQLASEAEALDGIHFVRQTEDAALAMQLRGTRSTKGMISPKSASTYLPDGSPNPIGGMIPIDQKLSKAGGDAIDFTKLPEGYTQTTVRRGNLQAVSDADGNVVWREIGKEQPGDTIVRVLADKTNGRPVIADNDLAYAMGKNPTDNVPVNVNGSVVTPHQQRLISSNSAVYQHGADQFNPKGATFLNETISGSAPQEVMANLPARLKKLDPVTGQEYLQFDLRTKQGAADFRDVLLRAKAQGYPFDENVMRQLDAKLAQ